MEYELLDALYHMLMGNAQFANNWDTIQELRDFKQIVLDSAEQGTFVVSIEKVHKL